MLQTRSQQRGFSLVELMIAMVLGLLVMGGVIQVFSSTKQTYRMQESLARVQENGRFALEILKPAIRDGARITNCAATIIPDSIVNTPANGPLTPFLDPAELVAVWEYNNTGPADIVAVTTPAAGVTANSVQTAGGIAIPAEIAALATAGSDMLMIKSGVQIPGLTVCRSGTGASPAQVPINWNGGCSAGEAQANLTADQMRTYAPQNAMVVIADCGRGAEMFQRGNAHTANTLNIGGASVPGNSSGTLARQYRYGAHFYRLGTTLFFVGVDVDGEPALYRSFFGPGGFSTPVAIVPGVESMQVLLGEIRGAGNQIVYVPGDQVLAAVNIAAVRVGLLVRSPARGDGLADPRQFDLVGTLINPQNDNERVRETFTTTVAIRNRLSGT